MQFSAKIRHHTTKQQYFILRQTEKPGFQAIIRATEMNALQEPKCRQIPTLAHKLPQVQNRKKQKKKALNSRNHAPFGAFLAESKGFEPSNTRLDVTRFPIVLLRPARTTLHIQRAQGASAYSLLIQDLVVRGELI